MKRHIDAGSFSGSVTLVARNGRVAQLEAQGLMDIEMRKPMAPNALFRSGWRKDTLKIGQEVTVKGTRAKNPESFHVGMATITTTDAP